MLFESIPSGCGGRWAFGTAILVYLVAYNETNGPTAVFAVILAAFYGAFSALCRSGVKHLQIPYIRASNKFDFLCLFLAVWMDVLALLAAIGALARTLSTCLDAMTGGLARILILGRNSPANEPWPDVLGVVVVFLVTGMFMLGLENTKAFSVLMILGILGINGILIAMSWLKGNLGEWNKEALLSNGAGSLLTAAALTSFAYPHEMANFQKWRCLVGAGLIFFVYIGISIAAACLSTILHCRLDKQYAAVPIFSLLDGSNLNKLVPAAACLLVLSCSGSLLELFPEMYYTIVRLATSEWKILAKQISYESPESGSPILAIFIAGSLSAMLAFACPLQNLSHILAASHLCSGLLRAFYLLYTPFRPKYIQQTNETSLSYSRLSPAPNKQQQQQQQQGNTRRKSLWNFNAPIQNAMKRSKSKLKNKVNCNNEVEREWLLLGEPSSPRPDTSRREAESGILSDADPVASDMEYVAKVENSDSDTSTDIDAIVDEYRQKVKVTTAGPMEKTIRVPSVSTWRISMFLISVILVGCLFTAVGITWDIVGLYSSGISTTSLFTASMLFLPKYTSSPSTTSPVVSVLTISLGLTLLSGCLLQSWPAIIFWFISGLILLIRCDAWCCLCLERPMSQQIIPSVSAKTASIRIPRPPKGLVIPGRIQSRR